MSSLRTRAARRIHETDADRMQRRRIQYGANVAKSMTGHTAGERCNLRERIARARRNGQPRRVHLLAAKLRRSPWPM